MYFFFFSSRRRHTRSLRDWSSDVCSSDLDAGEEMDGSFFTNHNAPDVPWPASRSEERRVGKECRSRWSPYHEKKNIIKKKKTNIKIKKNIKLIQTKTYVTKK